MTTPESLRRVQNGEVFDYQRPAVAAAEVAAVVAASGSVAGTEPAAATVGAKRAVALASAAPAAANVSMEDLVQWLIDHPWASHAEIGAGFGRPASWFSTVLVTPAFVAVMEPRRQEIQNPTVTSNLEQRMQSLLVRGMDVLQTKVSAGGGDAMLALEVAKVMTKALGYGMGVRIDPRPVLEPVTLEDLADRLAGLVSQPKEGVTDVVEKVPPADDEKIEVSPGAV